MARSKNVFITIAENLTRMTCLLSITIPLYAQEIQVSQNLLPDKAPAETKIEKEGRVITINKKNGSAVIHVENPNSTTPDIDGKLTYSITYDKNNNPILTFPDNRRVRLKPSYNQKITGSDNFSFISKKSPAPSMAKETSEPHTLSTLCDTEGEADCDDGGIGGGGGGGIGGDGGDGGGGDGGGGDDGGYGSATPPDPDAPPDDRWMRQAACLATCSAIANAWARACWTTGTPATIIGCTAAAEAYLLVCNISCMK